MSGEWKTLICFITVVAILFIYMFWDLYLLRKMVREEKAKLAEERKKLREMEYAEDLRKILED
jgi:hypothetical protein